MRFTIKPHGIDWAIEDEDGNVWNLYQDKKYAEKVCNGYNDQIQAENDYRTDLKKERK